MNSLFELPLDEVDGTSCYVDGDAGRWFVAGPNAELGAAAEVEPRAGEGIGAQCAPQGSSMGVVDEDTGRPAAPEAPTALRHVWLYTNTDCNLCCAHCLLPEHHTRPSLDELLQRLSEALGLGAKTVFLTGGEPFLRDDIEPVLAATASRARTVVLTNGTLVTPERLAALDALGAEQWKQNLSFQVSVDGDRHCHELIRGSGSFDRAFRGVEALTAWGRTPTISTAVTRLNIQSVDAVTALCGQLGVKAHHLFLPHQTGRLAGKASLVPPTAKLLEVMRRCRAVARENGVILDNDAALSVRVKRPGRRFVSCHGGHEMVAIGPDGRVYPCPSLVGEKQAGCDGSQGLSAALDSPPLRRFREYHAECRGECRRCPVRAFCGGGCAAYSYWTGRRFDAPEPYCDVYRGLIEDHLRAESVRLLEQSGGVGPNEILWPEGTPAPQETGRFDCA